MPRSCGYSSHVPSYKAPAPASTKSAPAPAPVQPNGSSMGGGLLGRVAEGAAYGTGRAGARRGVNAAIRSSRDSSDKAVVACSRDNKAFMDCIAANPNDIASCQFYIDMLNQCKQESVYM